MQTDLQQEMFDKDFDAFTEPGFPFTAKDDSGKWTVVAALNKLRFFTQLYVQKYSAGNSSRAAFQIVRNSMLQTGDLRRLRGADEPEPEELTAAQYHALPASQVARKYAGDPHFRDSVDLLIQRGQI
jgi:hypothetical protein